MAALETFPDIDDREFKLRLAHYITYGKGGYFLRKHDLKNQACYTSSAIYILICMFLNLSPDESTEKIKLIYKYGNFKSNILSNIIGKNAADYTSIRISNIYQLNSVFENGIVFLGLVTMGEDTQRYGAIHHYFLLKRNLDGTYSILSSYGSSNVAIRQYQTQLENPEEFNNFIKRLAEPDNLDAPEEYEVLRGRPKSEEARPVIDTFIKKFFLNPNYKTIQRKNKGDIEDTYGDEQRIPTDDPRWNKNEEADINREVEYYQKSPTYVMLFPNMLDLFNAEISALELKYAEDKFSTGEMPYNEYTDIYYKTEEISKEVLYKITATADRIAEAGLEITKESEKNIDAKKQELSPVESAETVVVDAMTTPPSKPKILPSSPFIERIKRSRIEEPLEEPSEGEDKSEKSYEVLNELGIVTHDNFKEFDISPEKKQEILEMLKINLEGELGGRRKTRKRKKTKRIKKMKKTKRKR